MGLDSVELVMAYEEAFKVEISDGEAESLQTPGDVIALVERKYGHLSQRMCLSQVSFYRIRKAFCEELGLPRKALRPGTCLAPLLAPDRAKRWMAIHSRTGLTYWPMLRTPGWLRLISLLLGPAIYLGWFGVSREALMSATLGVLLSIPAGMLVTELSTRPLQTKLPFATLGELAKDVGSFQFATLVGERIPSREQIAAAVRDITIAQLGIRPADYREDAEFVRDLGVD